MDSHFSKWVECDICSQCLFWSLFSFDDCKLQPIAGHRGYGFVLSAGDLVVKKKVPEDHAHHQRLSCSKVLSQDWASYTQTNHFPSSFGVCVISIARVKVDCWCWGVFVVYYWLLLYISVYIGKWQLCFKKMMKKNKAFLISVVVLVSWKSFTSPQLW